MLNKVKKLMKHSLNNLFVNFCSDGDYRFKVNERDIFLISYSKSGNTWMRFLLANLLTEDDINFVNVEDIIVEVYNIRNREIGKQKYKNIKIFKSHSYFNPKYANNKVIYIVRDVRDVVISYYYYNNKISNKEIDFDEFLKKFLDSNGLHHPGNWGDNVGSWIGAKINDKEKFLLVKYEDMLEDTYKELKKIAEFANFNVTDKKIRKAVEACDFRKLQKKEIEVEDKAIAIKDTRKDIKFFRKGKSGQWKDFLNEEQLKQIYEKFGYQMKMLGYLKDDDTINK